jgi:gephyrin
MVDLADAFGHIVGQDLHSIDPFPAFPASIMDGYAVIGPIEAGVYEVIDRVHAGDLPRDLVNPLQVSYITTGAMLPAGSNAVVKIEDTELVESSGSHEKRIRVNVSAKIGENVRQIGSDIYEGEVVLKQGDRIGPAELGLLATIGLVKIPCYKKPVIGVMSTGSELIDASDTPIGSQIRDSNRPTLLAAFREDGYQCIDLGIIQDQEHDLRDALLDAANRCDVVVTSGGVSMGAKDYVKPLLAELGTIHFGRLNMKPGKPTTFASLKSTLFFALPGNPVSCLVTKTLLIDPALKRIQGLDSMQCMHPQVTAKLMGSDIVMDAERPEYHRVVVSYDHQQGCLVAVSTGNQRSSRLLSMKSANALLCIAQGNGKVKAGETVTALLLRGLPPPTISSPSFHKLAASLDFPSSIPQQTIAAAPAAATKGGKVTSVGYESFDSLLKAAPNVAAIGPSTSSAKDWREVSVAILTISDRVRFLASQLSFLLKINCSFRLMKVFIPMNQDRRSSRC